MIWRNYATICNPTYRHHHYRHRRCHRLSL